MIRSTRPRLEDIDHNITVILERIGGKCLDDLGTDIDLRYVIHHALMIIAEAVRNIPPDLTAPHADIAWGKVVGIGNKIKHEYHRVNAVIVWGAVTQHLHPLQQTVRKMLTDLDQPGLPQ